MTKRSSVKERAAARRMHTVWPIVCAASIFVLSVLPSPGWPGVSREFFTSLAVSSRQDWLDVTANIVFYLPLGFTLVAAGVRRSRALLLGLTLSTTAELLQFVIPGRDPSLRDILTNTLGTALGVYLALATSGQRLVAAALTLERWLGRLLDPTEARANRMCVGYALFVAALTAATTILLVPWAPAVRQYVVANATIDALPGPVIIGAGGNARGVFKGLLDDVRIYTRARSEEEIERDSQTSVTSERTSDPSLVAAFGFETVPASGVAADASGRKHDGIFEGVPVVRGGDRHARVAAFDGTGRIAVPSAPSFGIHDAVTLEASVYLEETHGGVASLITQEGGAYFLAVSAASGAPRVVGGGIFGASPTATRSVEWLRPHRWTHVAMTYDGESIRIFVDGRLDATRHRWSPHRPQRIVLNGNPLPFGNVAPERYIAPELLRDFALNLKLTCGRIDPGLTAPLFLVTSARNIDPLALVAQGSDLLVRNWTIGRAIGLLAPEYTFRDALAKCSPGRPIDLQLSGTLKRPQLTVDDRTVPGAGLGIGSAWAFFIHSELLPGWLRDGCAICWLAVLLVPFGYWLRRGARGVLASALLVFGVIAVPILLGFASLTAGQLIAVAGGVLIGTLASRSRRARQSLPLTTA